MRDDSQASHAGPMNIAQALEKRHGKLPLHIPDYACRNREYARGWEKFYEKLGVVRDYHRLLLAETMNIAPTKHGMKIEYAPIDKDTLVRRIGLMHKLFANHLDAALPEHPAQQDIIDFMKSGSDSSSFMDLGDLETGKIPSYMDAKQIWLPTPHMLARWLSDDSAGIYLEILKDICNEPAIQYGHPFHPETDETLICPITDKPAMSFVFHSSLEDSITIPVFDDNILKLHEMRGRNVIKYLKEVAPKVNAIREAHKIAGYASFSDPDAFHEACETLYALPEELTNTARSNNEAME